MLKKFKEKSASQKFDTFLNVSFISFFIALNFLEWQGRDFPQESELQYSEGIITDTGFSIALQSIENPKQITLYGCSYNVFGFINTGSCMGPTYLEPRLGKYARVGWYHQPSFLGASNKLPQLVVLEVEGGEEDLQITYEDTKSLVFNQNMIRVLTTSIFGFGFIFFMTKLNNLINRPILYKEK
ncbi:MULTISPECIES: hypothetical protein [Psychrobacter]|uniref:hypothetical protein n=2 Tax=Moraxellaceae TaxID=468 RepID=UPI000C341038|nr:MULTISPECIES: hypothetical protein [Psychrobacter]MBA6244139.1 hypothetical protein [Psychrobacter sp. Urea-trap-18]MBA6285225.1 hypothetical protein [Psychrobacter sp. Urea-trap-16]MBA6319204.1 hypothetical protein [Psychrobacter sp. Urea-trap-20]MBA6333812.1 hypothetical protein [Psychrobacter sp. Urea-trap-19]PKG60204.1 hypothetical protein CXF63_08650 [Psychrobacter sp. Choline-3u-12]